VRVRGTLLAALALASPASARDCTPTPRPRLGAAPVHKRAQALHDPHYPRSEEHHAFAEDLEAIAAFLTALAALEVARAARESRKAAK